MVSPFAFQQILGHPGPVRELNGEVTVPLLPAAAGAATTKITAAPESAKPTPTSST